jgi:hypothetical protein
MQVYFMGRSEQNFVYSNNKTKSEANSNSFDWSGWISNKVVSNTEKAKRGRII